MCTDLIGSSFVGRQFGHYTIASRLGAGGMGEVYRARDARLRRDIALKVLPRQVEDDIERRSRLVREAQLAGSLHHPNICTVHEVGEIDAIVYIAMELVEGQSLSSQIAGRMHWPEVLRCGNQIASALAHQCFGAVAVLLLGQHAERL